MTKLIKRWGIVTKLTKRWGSEETVCGILNFAAQVVPGYGVPIVWRLDNGVTDHGYVEFHAHILVERLVCSGWWC